MLQRPLPFPAKPFARARQTARRLVSGWYLVSFGAGFSVSNCWIVIWAMTRAPIGPVSARRETGMISAVLIGILVLKERPGWVRIAAVAVATAGIALLKLSA